MSESFDRRTFLSRGIGTAAALSVGGGGLLAACGGGSSKGSSGASSGGSTGAAGGGAVSHATPKPGGSVVFGVEAEVDGFDPTSNRWDTTGHMYARSVYDRLAALDPSGKVHPYLAQSITPNSDCSQWTITLRPNVKFHNGDPLTAEVLDTNFTAHKKSGLFAAALTNIKSFSATGPLTFVVNMVEPWVPFDQLLAGYIGGQIAYVAHPSVFQPGGSRHPIGTGPFVFQSWVPRDHFTATKNPSYWRNGLPYLDSITFKPITDSQSRENSLKAGSIDGMHSSDTQNISDLRHDPTFNYLDDTGTSLGQRDLGFVMVNLDDPVMSDLRLRQALAHATDAKKYVQVAANGIESPVTGLFGSSSPYYSSGSYPSYDLAKATALVRAITHDKGRPPSISHATTNTPKSLSDASLLQAMWQQAGIQTTITQFEQNPLIVNALLGKYQTVAWRQFAASDPDLNYIWWSTGTAGPIGTFALNFARNKDATIQAALDKGRTSQNRSDRIAAYRTINERLDEDLPYIYLNGTIWMAATRKSVVNWANVTLPDGGAQLGFFQGIVETATMWREA